MQNPPVTICQFPSAYVAFILRETGECRWNKGAESPEVERVWQAHAPVFVQCVARTWARRSNDASSRSASIQSRLPQMTATRLLRGGLSVRYGRNGALREAVTVTIRYVI